MRNYLKRIRKGIVQLLNREKTPSKPWTKDQVELNLWGMNLSVSRETTSEIPSELTVVIPRAGYSADCTPHPSDTCDTRVIVNSITVVIAPRHPTGHDESSNEPFLPG